MKKYSGLLVDLVGKNNCKYASYITKKQCAVNMSDDLENTHSELLISLQKMIRPDLLFDPWNETYDSDISALSQYVLVLGAPYYVFIGFPREGFITTNQFESLKTFLLKLQEYNNNHVSNKKYQLKVFWDGILKIDYVDFQNRIDELIELLSAFIDDNIEFDFNENLIGDVFWNNKANVLINHK